MSLVRRNVTRTVKNSTETTTETDSPSSSSIAFALTTADAFYIGCKSPFACRYFAMATVCSASGRTVTLQYWNGSAWAAVEDVVDQTLGFTASGFISWQNPGSWAKKALTPIVDVDLYWIKLTVSGTLTAAVLQAVLNLFSDDALVRTYYPELISDTRYLPPDRTDYLEQHVAAKDLVVRRLKADKAIVDETQIIDPNELSLAAVHAFAWILLNPIARSAEDRERAQACLDDMGKEISRVPFDLDQNEDGIAQDVEKNTGFTFRKRG